MKKSEEPSYILFMGTFPPRECGIATFTKDLASAIDRKFSPLIKSKVLAVNKNATNIYNYPEEVVLNINDSDIEEYIDAAKKINEIEDIKLVNIQHEFGIFGGDYGNYLIPFLEILNKPVMITLHSIVPNPDDKLKRVVQAIAKKINCFVVMAEKAVEILRNDYGVDTDIEIIPHGIPTVSFTSNSEEKEKIGYKDKKIISSFGMMGPGKGYEYVIEALPEVIKKFPNLLYIIIGATHPVVRKKEGEAYRNFLENKVKELGLQKNVKFYNKYVNLKEIIKYIKASDIYICSNTDTNQITSGTLAYAVGCGRASISTPFLHAKEILSEDRGILVEFNNPKSFTDAILRLLSDEFLRKRMEMNSYSYTRHMRWQNVAMTYMKVFDQYAGFSENYEKILPKINLDYLIKLTDDFGIIQFSNNIEVDKKSGYTLDDNARAMIACCMHYSIFKDASRLDMINKYLEFMEYTQSDSGRLFNIVDINKNINLEDFSEDAHGRAMWSLGFLCSNKKIPNKIKKEAEQIFIKALKVIDKIKSPRAVAFILIGLYFYNKSRFSYENVAKIKELADHLSSLYEHNKSDDWIWFEEYLTYSNSKLPEALFYAYMATNNKKYLKIAESTLNFLISITFQKGILVPIGQKGWYVKNGQRAYFDQQPVDTASMVQTLVTANRITKNVKYKEYALTAFQWFLGKNILNQTIYDDSTGGCHDGIGESSINLNQGAESTTQYLIARLSFEFFKPNKKI